MRVQSPSHLSNVCRVTPDASATGRLPFPPRTAATAAARRRPSTSASASRTASTSQRSRSNSIKLGTPWSLIATPSRSGPAPEVRAGQVGGQSSRASRIIRR
nr:MAG TPA: hypothetical protein [Caudoviricetes sp.]